jgi:6,7-dimethyl-8-ribityllumazine synthase
MPYRTFQGSLDAAKLRIGVVVSRFNEFITEQLAKGALDALEKHGSPSTAASRPDLIAAVN